MRDQRTSESQVEGGLPGGVGCARHRLERLHIKFVVPPERVLQVQQYQRPIQHPQRQIVHERVPVHLRRKLRGQLDLPGGILRRQLIIVFVAGHMPAMSSGHELGVRGVDELHPVRRGEVHRRAREPDQLCRLRRRADDIGRGWVVLRQAFVMPRWSVQAVHRHGLVGHMRDQRTAEYRVGEGLPGGVGCARHRLERQHIKFVVPPERVLQVQQHQRLLQHPQRQSVRDERLPVYLCHELHGRLDLPGGILRRRLIIVIVVIVVIPADHMQTVRSRQILGRRTRADERDSLQAVRRRKVNQCYWTNTLHSMR